MTTSPQTFLSARVSRAIDRAAAIHAADVPYTHWAAQWVTGADQTEAAAREAVGHADRARRDATTRLAQRAALAAYLAAVAAIQLARLREAPAWADPRQLAGAAHEVLGWSAAAEAMAAVAAATPAGEPPDVAPPDPPSPPPPAGLVGPDGTRLVVVE